MDVNSIKAIANALLYEGHMLYPYRPSALKNRSQGWTFGTLLPRRYAEAHTGEASSFHVELIVTGSASAQIGGEVRFLQPASQGFQAIERTVSIPVMSVSELTRSQVALSFAFPQPGEADACCDPVHGMLQLWGRTVDNEAFRVTLTVENDSSESIAWSTRDQALRQALVSAHALLFSTNGEFVSLLDPPERLRAEAADCKQVGVFPVLAGTEGERGAMLVSPIILYDYPQIAVASQGDFFDSSEIDEMLTLRVLTLSDAEKEEIRKASESGRVLLERTESLSPEQILQLHGIAKLRGTHREE